MEQIKYEKDISDIEHLDLPRQLKMIRKAYLDFEWGKYVLWLVPDIYIPYDNVVISGEIILQMDGVSAYQSIPCTVRNPYPNTRIYQLGTLAKDKRKRIYGVPLVFDTLEELKRITSVVIEWVVVDENFPQIIHSEYFIDFEVVLDNKVYTIRTKDYPELASFLENDATRTYFSQFDAIYAYWSKDNSVFEEIVLDGHTFNEFSRKPSQAAPKPPAPDYGAIIAKLSSQFDISSCKEIYYYHFISKECLVPQRTADIICESCFGFSD